MKGTESMKGTMSAAVLTTIMTLGIHGMPYAQEERPETDAEQAEPAGSAQPEVEKKATDEGLEKRKKIISEATAAVRQTKQALTKLDEGKTEEALAALEVATGKLELILARDPGLALAPVDVAVITHDLVADPETVEETIEEAEELLEDGEVQQARPLVAGLASEIVVQTTNVPLATYPDAIKAVTPLIDEGSLKEAKSALQAALNTLVVRTEEVVPLPVLRARHLLAEAESLAENDERTIKDNETLADLLEEARTQLKMADLLGYGEEEAFEAMYAQLDEIERKTAGGKGGEGWFDTIRDQLSELL